jgi:hypothetical protein
MTLTIEKIKQMQTSFENSDLPDDISVFNVVDLDNQPPTAMEKLMHEIVDHKELLPCPFCGEPPRPIWSKTSESGKVKYDIGCRNYCCVAKADTKKKLIRKWNTRGGQPYCQSRQNG